ncbi:MAG: phytanoyl-CoA dioxygenase family protein [Cyanobacteria bacterium]|nr:phytanoyl-CoA dioxygenase family protein [Cyanobacteriota bacterium]MDW8202334.1 phytanoyl-CoA dioxygenase family protein [Cyanobacteriota bacterium SKYGB_h_bin112]
MSQPSVMAAVKSINLPRLEAQFRAEGWFVVQAPNPEPIYAARTALLNELRRLTGQPTITLETYHQVIEDDRYHTDLQIQLTNFFRTQRFGPQIIAAQLDFFQALLGRDLNVQSSPYLRITRPHKPQDNIGYHRDTFYGGSPFELSVLIPYVDVSAASALSVLPGSHLRPESDFPTRQIQSTEVTKGSPKHQLGFLYAPKLIDPACLRPMQPIPLKLGDLLIFSLATVHGSEENQGQFCRWSSDVRVVNALAPVDLSMRPTYYEPLSRSIVTETAEIYHQIQ